MKTLKNKWLELAIVLSAPLLSVIDVFIINVAIPAIKKGVNGSDGAVQLVIGQVLGGYLSQTHGVIEGWRLIFFINVPIGAATLIATRLFLSETSQREGGGFDYSGIAILTSALFCLIYPLIQGREAGWPVWSICLIVLSFGIFVFFIRNQRRKLQAGRNPLIDIRLFRIRDFNIVLLAVLFHFMLHTAYLLLSAVYLQNGLGVSAFDCGLLVSFMLYLLPDGRQAVSKATLAMD
jgi:MFS family permease